MNIFDAVDDALSNDSRCNDHPTLTSRLANREVRASSRQAQMIYETREHLAFAIWSMFGRHVVASQIEQDDPIRSFRAATLSPTETLPTSARSADSN